MKNERFTVESVDYPALGLLAQRYRAPIVEILTITLEQAKWIPDEIFRRELIPLVESEEFDCDLESLSEVAQQHDPQDRVPLLFALLCEAFSAQGIDVEKGISQLLGWRDPTREMPN